MGETDTRREPRTVLVVDDDGDARRLLCYALELDGYATEDAASGEQALIAYERLHPDAILLDIMMPGMDGFAVCARLRALHDDNTPVLMYTALEDSKSVERAFAVGADGYVTKSAGLDAICSCVNALFGADSAPGTSGSKTCLIKT